MRYPQSGQASKRVVQNHLICSSGAPASREAPVFLGDSQREDMLGIRIWPSSGRWPSRLTLDNRICSSSRASFRSRSGPLLHVPRACRPRRFRTRQDCRLRAPRGGGLRPSMWPTSLAEPIGCLIRTAPWRLRSSVEPRRSIPSFRRHGSAGEIKQDKPARPGRRGQAGHSKIARDAKRGREAPVDERRVMFDAEGRHPA